MKKLLFQLDTDPHASVFDTVVAYDGGADHVIGHVNVSPENVTSLVEGAVFTRAPKDKKNTALFIGGSNMKAGEELLAAISKQFFADFRVSVMLDQGQLQVARDIRMIDWRGDLRESRSASDAGFCRDLRHAIEAVPAGEAP